MSEESRNDEAEHAAPERWENVSSDIQRVADPVVRGVLIEQLERDREQWQQRSRNMAALRKERAEGDVRVLGDLAHLMKGIGRIESRQEVQGAQLAVIAAKVSTGEVAFEQLSKDTGGHRISIAELERRQAAAERQYAANVSKYAVDKVRFDERLQWVDRRQDKIEGEVVKTGQHAAVAHDKADRALSSQHEIIDVVKEGREEKRELNREDRDQRRWIQRNRSTVLGGMLVAVLTAALGYAVWRIERDENHAPARPAATSEVR
jgi:chromosome segregation ATPase